MSFLEVGVGLSIQIPREEFYWTSLFKKLFNVNMLHLIFHLVCFLLNVVCINGEYSLSELRQKARADPEKYGKRLVAAQKAASNENLKLKENQEMFLKAKEKLEKDPKNESLQKNVNALKKQIEEKEEKGGVPSGGMRLIDGTPRCMFLNLMGQKLTIQEYFDMEHLNSWMDLDAVSKTAQSFLESFLKDNSLLSYQSGGGAGIFLPLQYRMNLTQIEFNPEMIRNFKITSMRSTMPTSKDTIAVGMMTSPLEAYLVVDVDISKRGVNLFNIIRLYPGHINVLNPNTAFNFQLKFKMTIPSIYISYTAALRMHSHYVKNIHKQIPDWTVAKQPSSDELLKVVLRSFDDVMTPEMSFGKGIMKTKNMVSLFNRIHSCTVTKVEFQPQEMKVSLLNYDYANHLYAHMKPTDHNYEVNSMVTTVPEFVQKQFLNSNGLFQANITSLLSGKLEKIANRIVLNKLRPLFSPTGCYLPKPVYFDTDHQEDLDKLKKLKAPKRRPY